MPLCLLFPSLRPLWKIILFGSRGSAYTGSTARGSGQEGPLMPILLHGSPPQCTSWYGSFLPLPGSNCYHLQGSRMKRRDGLFSGSVCPRRLPCVAGVNLSLTATLTTSAQQNQQRSVQFTPPCPDSPGVALDATCMA